MFHSNWRFRLVLVSLILLVVSGYFSYVEMAYLFQSRSVPATVTQLSEVTAHRRSSSSKQLQFEYTFAEPNGTRRSGNDSQPLGWEPPVGGTILVQYTPGEHGRSRPEAGPQSTAAGSMWPVRVSDGVRPFSESDAVDMKIGFDIDKG